MSEAPADLTTPQPEPARRLRPVGALSAVIAVLLLAGVLALITAPPDDDGGAGTLLRFREATEEAGAFRFETTLDAKLGSFGFSMTMAGRADPTAEAAELRLQVPFASDNAAFTMVIIGADAYLIGESVGGCTRLPADRLADGDVAGGFGGFGPLGGVGGGSPIDALAQLDLVVGGVRAVGTEEIRGVSTTHYTATLNLRQAIEDDLDQHGESPLLPEGIEPGDDEALAALERVPIDVWVDDDDRLRRYRMEMTVPAPPGQSLAGGPVTVIADTELFDFGAVEPIQAPAGCSSEPPPDLFDGEAPANGGSRAPAQSDLDA